MPQDIGEVSSAITGDVCVDFLYQRLLYHHSMEIRTGFGTIFCGFCDARDTFGRI